MRILITPEKMWIGRSDLPTPAGLLSDPVALAELLSGHGPDTIIVPPSARDVVLHAAGSHGYNVTRDDGGSWMTMTRKVGKWSSYLHVGVYNVVHNGQLDPLLYGDPYYMAEELRWWYDRCRTEYHTSPAVTAIASMREFSKRAIERPRWILQDAATAEYWQPPAQIHDIVNAGTCTGPHHKVDVRSAYLAAAAAVDLPYKQLTNTGADTDPHDSVGYFRIRPAVSGMLDTLGRLDDQGCLWVGHPVLRVVTGIIGYDLIDSWTSDHSGRILRPWAEAWRDMMWEADERLLLRRAVKDGYSQALGGLLAVPRGTVYRPDWRHLIIEQVKASMMRKVQTHISYGGEPPCRVDRDSMWFHAEPRGEWMDPLPPPYPTTGSHIGNLRYEGIETL